MKQLHLIRHAKSSWTDPELADIDRPLNQRGLRSSHFMAPIIAQYSDWQQCFSSTAQRAQATVDIICKATGQPWQTDSQLYTFSYSSLLHWCQQLDDQLDKVCLVGHNPAFTDFINHCSDQQLAKLPTCAYAKLNFNLQHWHQLGGNTARLELCLSPKTQGFKR